MDNNNGQVSRKNVDILSLPVKYRWRDLPLPPPLLPLFASGCRMTERNRLSTDSSPKLQIPYQKVDKARWKKSHVLRWEGKKLQLVAVLVSSIKRKENRTMNSVPLSFFFFVRIEIPYPRKDNIWFHNKYFLNYYL